MLAFFVKHVFAGEQRDTFHAFVAAEPGLLSIEVDAFFEQVKQQVGSLDGLVHSIAFANYAGGVVVMKTGTATLSPDELRDAVGSDHTTLEGARWERY